MDSDPIPIHPQDGHSDGEESIQTRFDSPLPSFSCSSNYYPRTRKIAFLTSGGDSQGMNAAIRAIVRTAIAHRCHPVAVFEGFKGLLEGHMKVMRWDDVAFILSEGGTVIKSSRCPEFMRKEFRTKAVLNLLREGIDKLIVIGGDGSLTGADTLRSEWGEHVEELLEAGEINAEMAAAHPHLMVVGLVGSIDNDMCGTEITIGANTSLHRITEAVDNIRSTANSHSRAFIIEVMGRHCGWLALNAALAVGADWLFIPEAPPELGWEEAMCSALKRNREMGKMATIVILAEGAVDHLNNPIKASYLQSTISDHLSLDTRVTTLGHVQRGGVPSAFDRYLGTLQGVHAVRALLNADPAITPSLLIVKRENRVGEEVLRECVERTKITSTALKECQFSKAFAMRDPDFINGYSLLQSLSHTSSSPPEQKQTIAVVHCGAPSGGMNAAVWAIVYYSLFQGHKVLGVANGFSGLADGDVREFKFADVEGWIWKGGSDLGTNRTLPNIQNIQNIKANLKQYKVTGLIVIGGFEAFSSLVELQATITDIPLLCIPATISNNVPGTDYSLGTDTALNVIVTSCDAIKQSASSSRKRVFVVEVQGGQCGYLATMAGLGCGATYSYIPEEGLRLKDLQRDIQHLKKRFHDDKKQGRIVLRCESVSTTYTTELISKIFEEEADGEFDSRWTILGHLQQGTLPSPMDRIRAIRLAILCVKRICTMNSSDSVSRAAEVIGIRGPSITFTPVNQLIHQADMLKRCPKEPWWMELRPIVKMLAKYGPIPHYSAPYTAPYYGHIKSALENTFCNNNTMADTADNMDR